MKTYMVCEVREYWFSIDADSIAEANQLAEEGGGNEPVLDSTRIVKSKTHLLEE